MSRPFHCKHLLYPSCGCVEPPVLASDLILKKEREEKEKAEAPRKPGRPKTPWGPTPKVDPHEEFLKKLPDVMEDPYARADLVKLIDRTLAVASFSQFVRMAWHVVEPTTTLEWNWHHELICTIIQGIFEDWEHAQDDPKFKQRVRNCVMNVPPGSLKPVDENGLVTEKSRGLIPLKEVREGDQVLTHQGRFRKVLKVAEQGILPVVEIVTGRGRTIRAEATHPILTQRGWVPAGEITTRDTLAEVHGEDGGTPTISPEEARLLGYIIGDGCIRPTGHTSFTNKDPETIADFEHCATACGFDHTRKEVRSGTNVVSLKSKDRSDFVKQWVTRHGLFGAKSATKRVPQAVLAGDRETVLNYLSAYWACDGAIHDRRDLPRSGRNNQTTQTVRVSATTISPELATEHQHLLQKIGMSFRLRKKIVKMTTSMVGRSRARVGDLYTSYDIVASDQDTAAKFVQTVNPYMRHEKRTRAQGLVRTDFDRVLNPDNVVDIRDGGVAACRCLQVEEDSSFVYQGVAVHNSRLLAVMFPVWCWLRRPGMRFLCLSVNENAAMRDARDSRTILKSDWFVNLFQPTWTIKDDQDSISNYGNSAGGVRLSNTLSSKIIGNRGDCLAGHSLISTEAGEIPIEVLHNMPEGTWPKVWSFNEETHEVELKCIRATRRINDRPVVEVTTNNGNVLTCTPDHRVYSEGEWVAAKDLGGRVLLEDGTSTQAVTQVKPMEAHVPVYDIEVEGNHNFFAEGILVHNCILIDDANDPKEAESKLVRDTVNDIYNSNVHNRVNHSEKSIRIGIQQRVHSDDWTGYVTKKEGVWTPEDPDPWKWLHVIIPAEFEPDKKCITPWGEDPRKEKGESLHPERMSPEFLQKERERFGSARYAGQMQQRPTLAEGGMVKTRWLRFCHFAGNPPLPPDKRFFKDKTLNDEIDRDHPSREILKVHGYWDHWDFDWTLISVDPASKKTERGSQHGILVLAGKGPQRFLLEDQSFRGDILEVLTKIERLCMRYEPERILIEAKAAGPALMTLFEERFQRGKIVDKNGKFLPVVIEPIEPQGDKITRLDACLPELEAGLLHILDGGEWVEPFISELCGFPASTYDDRVDALSQALNHMRSWGSYQLPRW